MHQQLLQLNKALRQHYVLILSVAYIATLPLYIGEILTTDAAYIFGKYINYLHIRVTLRFLLGTILLGAILWKNKAFLKEWAKKYRFFITSGILFLLYASIIPFFNGALTTMSNFSALYTASISNLFFTIVNLIAVVCATIQVLQSAQRYHGKIAGTLATSLALQGLFAVNQFLAKGPWLPDVHTWTGQPAVFTSNAFWGITEYFRIYGTTPHPNILATILCFFLVIIFFLAIPKTYKVAIAAGIILLILGTLSRVGIAASICVTALYLTRHWTDKLTVRNSKLAVPLIVSSIYLLPLLLSHIPIAFSAFPFLESRRIIATLYNELLTNTPLLFAHGTGFVLSIPTLLATSKELPTSIIWGNQILAEPPHNIAQLLLVEFGIIGTGLISLIVYASATLVEIRKIPKWIILSLFLLLLLWGSFDHLLVY